MTSRAKILLLCTALAASANVSLAANPTEATAERAIVLNLAATDLDALSDAIQNGYFADTLTGRVDTPFSQDHWFGTVSVHGISYSFRVSSMAIVPRQDRILVGISLSQVRINVERIDFNESGSRYCTNMLMHTNGYTIGGRASIAPAVHDRQFSLDVTERVVELAEHNFNAEQPSYCDVAWGFNWIISRAMPWLVERSRDTLADAVAERVAVAIEEFGGSLNDYLAVGITWPFDLPPAPPFYATAALWPQGVTVNNDGFQFAMSADVTFDPDERRWQNENELAASWLTGPQADLPSFLGIGNDLIGAIIKAANDGGLFAAKIDQTVWPAADSLLTAGAMKAFIPDLATRFPANTPITIRLSGAAATQTAISQVGDEAAMDLRLTGLRLALSVGNQPYYSLTADANVRLTAAYDQTNRRMSLNWRGLDLVYKDGAFAPGLVPAVTDARFISSALQPWTTALYTRLAGSGDGPGISIPSLGMGGYTLTPEGVSVRGDLVTLDARLLAD